jgi:hypothetical protein
VTVIRINTGERLTPCLGITSTIPCPLAAMVEGWFCDSCQHERALLCPCREPSVDRNNGGLCAGCTSRDAANRTEYAKKLCSCGKPGVVSHDGINEDCINSFFAGFWRCTECELEARPLHTRRDEQTTAIRSELRAAATRLKRTQRSLIAEMLERFPLDGKMVESIEYFVRRGHGQMPRTLGEHLDHRDLEELRAMTSWLAGVN